MMKSIFMRDVDEEVQEIIDREGVTKDNEEVLQELSQLSYFKDDMMFLDELRGRLRLRESENRDTENIIKLIREEANYIFDKHKDVSYVKINFECQQEEGEVTFSEYKDYIIDSIITDEEFRLDVIF